MRKRIFAAFICLCMMMALVPSMAYANDTVYTGGLCEHHTQHDGACGYSEETAEIPCSHEHNESCGGLTDPAACNHSHDKTCGYVPATAGTPCTFVCEVCNPQDNGDAATPSDAQPEECTCETLCTEEEINGDCPVCSAEGAELDKVCIGAALMLPVTALAVETNTVYVGGVALAGSSDSIVYATTNESGEVITEGATADNYNIKWDGSTLTLHDTTIQKELYASDLPLSNIAGAAIGVINQCGDAGLTVQLEGNNKIEGVSTGIHVRSSGGNAALNITGNGTLVVNSNYLTIQVTSIGGNAALSIENAKVTATSSYSNVVTVQSGNSENSSASLTVDGGSLTATAPSNNVSGIRFVFGSGGSGSGTPNLTVSDNAIVRANGSAGGITSNSSAEVQTAAGTGESGGIVFDNGTGTVYGDVKLQEDLEIGEGESLTIGKDASLTVPDGTTLTNKGTVTTEEGGTLINNGKIDNSGTLPDNIQGSAPPKITTASLPNGEVNKNYSQSLAATGNGITWSLASGSTLPNGLTLNSDGTISGTPTAAGTSTFTITATNGNGSDSKEFTLSINEETKYSLTVNLNGGNGTTTDGQYTKGTEISIDAGTKSGYRFAGWTSSNGGTFANASSASTTFTMPDNAVTITANWKKKSSSGSVFFWDLKFDTNGGSKIDTVTEWEYSTIDLDEYVPEKEGYKFVGWYADEDLTKKIDEVYLTQDTTVYAKWEKIEEEVPEEPDEVEETEEPETISFLDVKESDWFYDAVSYVVENGLMSGMSEDIFAPNTPLTREMLAVVLYNVEEQPESTEANAFTDVKADMWYTDAILWANANGIVAGYDNGAYGVGDLITREQFAVMLYRYAQFKGCDTTQGGMAVREFSDYENISDYARPAMAWAVNASVMGGMDDGTLNSQGKATRAEAATMLMNFCENVVK